MRKLLLVLICILLSVICSSCATVDDNNDTDPIINNDSFTNFIPWWVTNEVEESSDEYIQ